MSTLTLRKEPSEFTYVEGTQYRSNRHGIEKRVWLIKSHRHNVELAQDALGRVGRETISKAKFEKLYQRVG